MDSRMILTRHDSSCKPHLGELVIGGLAVQLLRGGGGVGVGGRPLLIGWLHAGVSIATIGRGLIGHIIGRRY